MLITDPCGLMCLLVTYLAIIYADYVVVRWIILETMSDSLWGAFHVLMFNTGIFFLAFAHMKAVLMDPGVVPLPQVRLDFSDVQSNDEAFDRADWTLCRRCETYRPPRAHHCRICKRCIRRMDHHCPWINNCVGERNQKFFLQFLVYVGILACYTVILVILSWLRHCPSCLQEDVAIKQARILHSVILMLECVLFGMFVTAILIDQLQAIVNETTAVEQAQNRGQYRRKRPKMQLIGEVCGRTHPMMWLLPCGSPSRKLDAPLLSHTV